MAPRVLMLAGAPEAHSLDWGSVILLDGFLEPIRHFAGLDSSSDQHQAQSNGSLSDIAVWRSIPLERQQLRTGFSQDHDLDASYCGDQGFFTTLDTSLQETGDLSDTSYEHEATLAEFYEHSIAVYGEIRSSQLPSESFDTSNGSFDRTEDTSLQDSVDDVSATFANRTLGLGNTHLSDLEDLPNAAYLESLYPQTMDVSLIVGVISVAEPRTVKTRWGATKSLVELLVGDETKSGFSVTFWLSHGSETATDTTLKSLRRQDIILLRNVALSYFREKVHGHSLRKDSTKIDLLHRRKLHEDDVGGFYTAKELSSRKGAHPQLLKTRRVRDWVLNFVGVGTVSGGKTRSNAVRSWDMPPADPQ